MKENGSQAARERTTGSRNIIRTLQLNVSIPSNVFIIYFVRVGFEIRRNEKELDVNTQVVFDYSLWRPWITQSLFKEQTIWSNSYNWKTGTDAPNLNNSQRNLVKAAFLWRKRFIRKLFPLPNVPWNRENWFLLNTDSNQHFIGENA